MISQPNLTDVILGARVTTPHGGVSYAISRDELSHELLRPAMLLRSGAPLDLTQFREPRARPELAFLLSHDPAGFPTIATVLAATSAVLGVVTISEADPDRRPDPRQPVGHPGTKIVKFVLGPRAVPCAGLDVRLIGCVLRVQGEVVATAAGAAALGHPAAAVAWLIREVRVHSTTFQPGWLLCSGALTPDIELTPGMSICAEFEGLGAVDLCCA